MDKYYVKLTITSLHEASGNLLDASKYMMLAGYSISSWQYKAIHRVNTTIRGLIDYLITILSVCV
jgi:hypothetical protein